MQAMLQKFDDADAEREDEVNKDYFKRYERKSNQPNLVQVSDTHEDGGDEKKAKAAIMKDILANFQFVQTDAKDDDE